MTPQLETDPATAVSESARDQRGCLALDQWRGLALLMVLVSHGFIFTHRVGGIGRVGVNLFFFISGILVFRSLSHARAKDSWSRTRSFWWRRFRRLYPAMVSYVLVMLAATWWLQRLPGIPPNSDFRSVAVSTPAAFTYVINYLPDAPTVLGHLWSLACEMQFYLLAPIIYLLGGKMEARRLAVFATVLIILFGLGLLHPFLNRWDWKYHFEFAVWPMMLGFFCEYRRAWFNRWPELVVKIILWLGIALCGVNGCLMLFGFEMKLLVIGAGALLLAPCLLAYLYGRPVPGIAGEGLRWCGERTYSIYLWQQPFTICNFLPALWHPFGSLAAIAVGALWFRLFEFPFLSSSRQRQEKSR